MERTQPHGEDRTMHERTRFIHAVKFDAKQRSEINEVTEWLTELDDLDFAAAYIVWLQSQLEQ